MYLKQGVMSSISSDTTHSFALANSKISSRPKEFVKFVVQNSSFRTIYIFKSSYIHSAKYVLVHPFFDRNQREVDQVE